MSCTAGLYLSRGNYITNELHVPYLCQGTCNTAGNFLLDSDTLLSACLWCDKKCAQCLGPRDYQCSSCVTGGLSATSAHLCGTQLINPSLASNPLQLTLPGTYATEDASYTLMFWLYADYTVSPQDVLQASPWQFSIASTNTLTVTDQTTSLLVASVTMSSGWHHLALSAQPSPLSLQVVYDDSLVLILALPAAFRRITSIFLGNSSTTGRLNGYITDLYILNGALRAFMIGRLWRTILDSGILLDMTIGVSYQLTEGSGQVVRGLISDSETYVSLPGVVWDTAPSVPNVCDALSSTGIMCQSPIANCAYRLSSGCLFCSSGNVVSSDMTSCVGACVTDEYQLYGRCFPCVWPCISCSMASGSMMCSACASGSSPVSNICPDTYVQTLYFTPFNEFALMTLLSSVTSTALTVEFWINFKTFPSANEGYLAIGTLFFLVTPAQTSLVKQGANTYGTISHTTTWQHIAVVLDLSNAAPLSRLALYLNGAVISLSGYTGQVFDYSSVKIGPRKSLSCGIREVRIWNVARTSTQILYNYAYTVLGSSLPAELILAVPFANGNNQDLVSSKDFGFSNMFGYLPEVHLHNWPIANLGSYLCGFTSASGPGSGSCTPCNQACEPTKHCLGPGANQCEGCAVGYLDVSGTCTGLPVFRKSTGICTSTVQATLASPQTTWTVDFWVYLLGRPVGNAQIIAATSGVNEVSVTLPTSGGTDINFVSTIASVVVTSPSTILTGAWTHLTLQSISLGAITITRSLLNGSAVLRISTTLGIQQLTLGGTVSFSGYIRTLRVWNQWIDAPLMMTYAKMESVAFPGRVAEWDFTSTSSLVSGESFTGDSSCLSQIAQNSGAQTCPVLQNYATVNGVTGLLSCSNACSASCSICTSSSCVACNTGAFLLSSVCQQQINLVLDGTVALSWPLPSSTWTGAAVTITAWVKPNGAEGTPVFKLTETSHWLGVTTTAALSFNVQYDGSTIASCGGTVGIWQHIALILIDNGSFFGLRLYCALTLQADLAATSVPLTSFTGVVLSDSSMTSTRALKMVKIYSWELVSMLLTANSKLWAPVIGDLVFNTPLEGAAGVLFETISGVSVTLPGGAFSSEAYTLGLCNAGQRYVATSPMCLTCEDSNCFFCQDTIAVCTLCNVGYYALNGVCTLCDSNCYVCLGTATTCLKCTSNAALTVTNSCLCNGGFYPAAGATLSCSSCDATCLTCSNGTNSGCLSCLSSRALASGQCLCNDGTYPAAETTPLCSSCASTCITCSNGTNSGCLSCLSPRTLVSGQCLIYGLFSTQPEANSYLALCTLAGSPISPIPGACQVFLGPYCCPANSQLYPKCQLLLPLFQCRSCTFESTSLCDRVESLCWNSDASLKPLNDPCLTGIYWYCCQSHASAYDCSVFPHQFNCGQLGPPLALSAVWDGALQSFNVTFSMAVAPLAGTYCGVYFDLATLTALGSNPRCEFTSQGTVLKVSIGPGATISTGPVSFLPNTLTAAYKYAANGPFGSYLNLQLTLPAINFTPQAVLVAAATISTCSDLRLDGWSSTGSWGRPLLFRWRVASSLPSNSLDTYMSAYSSYAANFGKIVIPAGKLAVGSELRVTLEVSNAFGYSSTTTETVKVFQGALPQIQLAGGNSFNITASQYAEFTVLVLSPGCGAASYEVQWTLATSNCTNSINFASLLSSLANPWTLALPSYTLKANCSYLFQVTVSNTGLPAMANLTVSVGSKSLQALILGGDTQLAVNQSYTLDASRSIDPDIPAPALTFLWTRCQDGGACKQISTSPFYIIDSGSLTAGSIYVYSVEVRNGQRTATASRYILAAADANTPAIFILPLKGPLNPTDTNVITAQVQASSLVKLQWHSSGPATFTSPRDQPTISIAPFSLTPGATYKFQLQVAILSAVFTADLSAYVNCPPSGGWLTVTPLSGFEVMTVFELETQGWSDFEQNLPLTYQFYRADNETLAITTLGLANFFYTTLAAGDLHNRTKIVVRAFDSYQAYSELQQVISVGPAYSNQKKQEFLLDITQAQLGDSRNQSLPSMPAKISAISTAAFSAYSNETVTSKTDYSTEVQIYTNLLQLIENWWDSQPAANNTVDVVTDTLVAITRSPVLLTNQTIGKTLDLVDKITDNPLDLASVQSTLLVLSNLEDGNAMEEIRMGQEISVTQNRIRENLVSVGRAAVYAAVRDQDPVITTSPNFNGYFQRISPAKLPSMQTSIQSLVSSSAVASVSLPADILQSLGLDSQAGLDMLFVLSKNKYNRGGHANTTQVANYTELVTASDTLKLQLERSGSVNQYGEFLHENRSEVSVKFLPHYLNVTLPFQAASTNATTSCVFYNVSLEQWSTSGCALVEWNWTSKVAKCACNHLTEFSLKDMEDGAIAAAGSANVEEAINIEALAELDLTTNALGLYIAIALLSLYIALGGVCIWVDRSESRKLDELYNNPKKCMADTIAHNKVLYDIFASEPRLPESSRLPPTPNEAERPSASTLLYLSHYGINHSSAAQEASDFSQLKPASDTEVLFHEDRVVRTGRTCWELIVSNHSLLGLFFWVNTSFPRFARLTVFFCALFGKLFVTGFFYDSSDAKVKEEPIGLEGVLARYSWYDFFIAIMSALILFPGLIGISMLLRKTRLADYMSPSEKVRICRRNKVRNCIGYGLAWCWMAVCAIEITLFSIQFNVRNR